MLSEMKLALLHVGVFPRTVHGSDLERGLATALFTTGFGTRIGGGRRRGGILYIEINKKSTKCTNISGWVSKGV